LIRFQHAILYPLIPVVRESRMGYSLKVPQRWKDPGYSMEENAQPNTTPMKRIMSWVGAATALIGLGASLAGGVRWYENRRQHKAELASQMAVAETQAKVGEYQAAARSYDRILKDNPLDHAALKEQLQTAMEWVEDFHVVGGDGQDAAGASAPQLDEIMAVLDAGLARSQGSEAADVQAHIGWAHWLNQKIAEREFGSAARQNFQEALKIDPSNVYANVMLGNWMLQNAGDPAEAIAHFRTAVATGRARPMVRRFEIGGMADDNRPLRAELIKTANEMRKDGEPLDELSRRRILYFCFDPPYTQPEELAASLSAVPAEDAWTSYQWLTEGAQPPVPEATRAYVHATLLEISGDKEQALAIYSQLQKQVDDSNSLKRLIDEAVKRVSKR
jgi:tetratricopeptide (TPR) repeat protein